MIIVRLSATKRPNVPEGILYEYESDFSSLKEMRCEDVKTQEPHWNVAVSVSLHLRKPLKLSLMGTSFSPGDAIAINPPVT